MMATPKGIAIVISHKPAQNKAQDTEQYWRTGKKPSGYQDSDDEPDSDDTGGQISTSDIAEDIQGVQGGDQVLSALDAVYAGPEDGPFRCDTCAFFVADGQPCQKVSDSIASGGCCVLWQKSENASQNGNQDLDQSYLDTNAI